MSGLGKLGLAAVVLVGGYLGLLVALSVAFEGCVVGMAQERLAESLDAEVTVGDTSVSLLRGTLALSDVRVERMSGGHMLLTMERAEVDIAPLGWAAIDREPDRVAVRGVDLSISARGAVRLPTRDTKRRPLAIGSMHIERLRFEAMATALLPGLGRVALTIEEGRTGAIAMKSSIDWLFAMRELRARAELPGSVEIAVRYQDDRLGVSGGVFGSELVSVPFTMPVPNPDDLELAKLRLLIVEVGKALSLEAGKKWFQDGVKGRLRGLLDRE